MTDISRLPAFSNGSRDVNAVVETPKGSRNKFNYDPELGLFRLGGAMPAGVEFPFEFGFIPSTLGEDGDPLDLLILMDAPSFTGCVVNTRLVGVIEADQTEKGKTVRNDRLIGVATDSRRQEDLRSIRDLAPQVMKEIEYFFISYNQIKGKTFRPRGRFGPKRALKLVMAGVRLAERRETQG